MATTKLRWPKPNTMKDVILRHMSLDMMITAKEMFSALEKNGYHVVEFYVFKVELNQLKNEGLLSPRLTAGPGYRYMQYLLSPEARAVRPERLECQKHRKLEAA